MTWMNSSSSSRNSNYESESSSEESEIEENQVNITKIRKRQGKDLLIAAESGSFQIIVDLL